MIYIQSYMVLYTMFVMGAGYALAKRQRFYTFLLLVLALFVKYYG